MSTKINVLIAMLFSVAVFGDNIPPVPQPTSAPVPVGLPIDAWVIPVFVIGLLYGVKVYTSKQRAV
ncbi:hypothetical protein [Neptunitalea chrysea]|nr:hypothetical protein [Neptunitalea chrysea]